MACAEIDPSHLRTKENDALQQNLLAILKYNKAAFLTEALLSFLMQIIVLAIIN